MKTNILLLNILALALALTMSLAACGGDADKLGIGAQCDAENTCATNDDFEIACLTEYKGGYCSLKGCAKNADCPEDSICVTHNGANQCFRSCTNKDECNANRDADNESNCSSSIETVEKDSGKACLPPSDT